MKTLVKIMALLCMAPLCSCTKTLYTHEQAMSKYITKDNLVKTFGIPTERIKSDSTEQWLYKFEKNAQLAGPGEQFVYTASVNTRTEDVETFTIPKRYLLFFFDKQGKVIQWHAEGVDFTKKEFSAGRTAGLVVGITGAVVIVAVLVANSIKSDLSSAFSGITFGD